MFAVQFLLDGVKVNLTLVEELVAKYRFDLDKPLPEGEGQNPWALAEKWATVSQVLPEYTPDLGQLHQHCNNDSVVTDIEFC